MSMHNRHENMPADAVLADDCDRCDQHARDPFMSLDDSHLSRLLYLADHNTDKIVMNIPTVNDLVAVGFIKEVQRRSARLERIRNIAYTI